MQVLIPPRAAAIHHAADRLHRAVCCDGDRAVCERETRTSYLAILDPFEAAVEADTARAVRADAAWVTTGVSVMLLVIALVAESVGSIQFQASPLWAFTFIAAWLGLPVAAVYWRQLCEWVGAVARRPRRGVRRGWWWRA